jgi:hypothetical protein
MIISPMKYFSGLLGIFMLVVPTVMFKMVCISPEHNGMDTMKLN